MSEDKNYLQPAIPRFDSHYDHWSMLMENLLRSKGYWSLVETGYEETTLQAEEVEILLVKGKHQSDENFSTKHPQIIPIDDELQILKGQETMAGLRESCSSSREHLILAYRQKGIIKS